MAAICLSLSWLSQQATSLHLEHVCEERKLRLIKCVELALGTHTVCTACSCIYCLQAPTFMHALYLEWIHFQGVVLAYCCEWSGHCSEYASCHFSMPVSFHLRWTTSPLVDLPCCTSNCTGCVCELPPTCVLASLVYVDFINSIYG